MFHGFWEFRTWEIVLIRKISIYKKTCVHLFALFVLHQQFICNYSWINLPSSIKLIHIFDLDHIHNNRIYYYCCDEKNLILIVWNNIFKYYVRIFIIQCRYFIRNKKWILCLWKCNYVIIGSFIHYIKL